MTIRINASEIPYVIEAGSTDELAMRLQGHARRYEGVNTAEDHANQALQQAIVDGVQKVSRAEGMHYLFREAFYVPSAEGAPRLNGAPVYRQSLLNVLGRTASVEGATGSKYIPPIRDQTVLHPENNKPFRRWQWRGVGLLRITGFEDVLVLEGNVKRPGTTRKEPWVDYEQLGALMCVDVPQKRTGLRPVNLDEIYEADEELPTDFRSRSSFV